MNHKKPLIDNVAEIKARVIYTLMREEFCGGTDVVHHTVILQVPTIAEETERAQSAVVYEVEDRAADDKLSAVLSADADSKIAIGRSEIRGVESITWDETVHFSFLAGSIFGNEIIYVAETTENPRNQILCNYLLGCRHMPKNIDALLQTICAGLEAILPFYVIRVLSPCLSSLLHWPIQTYQVKKDALFAALTKKLHENWAANTLSTFMAQHESLRQTLFTYCVLFFTAYSRCGLNKVL